MKQKTEHSDKVCRFVVWLLENPGKTKSVIASNPAGVLWEQLWRFDGNQFWTITVTPDVYDDWTLILPTKICKSIEDAFIASS